MKTINNCDELLSYLYEAYDICNYCCNGHIEFKGATCEIGGFLPDRWCTLMPSSKFPKTVFCIQYLDEHYLMLNIFKGDAFVLDETLGVVLPIEVRDELIDTIEGYNY